MPATKEQLDRARELSKLSPRVGKKGKHKKTIAIEKALEKKAMDIVEAMMKEREAIMLRLPKVRNKAKYRDLIDGLDKATKNIQLLTGQDTSRVGGMGILLDQLEKEDE